MLPFVELIKLTGKMYFLRNNCPFDSLAQIVFTSLPFG